jgi:hypothetical protein
MCPIDSLRLSTLVTKNVPETWTPHREACGVEADSLAIDGHDAGGWPCACLDPTANSRDVAEGLAGWQSCSWAPTRAALPQRFFRPQSEFSVPLVR